jgi:outer membrane protein TolC
MRLLFAILLTSSLHSNSLLKESKKEVLQKGREEAQLYGDTLRDSWLGGINVEGSYNYLDSMGSDETYPSFRATLYQDIFRSGGIWWQIDKGKIYKSLNFAMLDSQERDMVFSLYNTVLGIQKLDIELRKMELTIENQNILIRNQRESYSNGLLDISVLDQSIIDLNTLKNQQEGLIQTRIDLIASLKVLTDLNYTNISVPNFVLPTLEEFLNKSFDLEIQKLQIESSRLDKNLAYAQFLPAVQIYGTYDYTDTEAREGDETSIGYGVKITIPIGFNAGNAIEAAQISYLKAQSEYIDKESDERVEYEKIVSKLKSIERRKKNSMELIESYQSILKITEEYYKSQLKTVDDVTLVKNRVKISQHDLEIYKIDKKIVIVKLYQGIRGE